MEPAAGFDGNGAVNCCCLVFEPPTYFTVFLYGLTWLLEAAPSCLALSDRRAPLLQCGLSGPALELSRHLGSMAGYLKAPLPPHPFHPHPPVPSLGGPFGLQHHIDSGMGFPPGEYNTRVQPNHTPLL